MRQNSYKTMKNSCLILITVPFLLSFSCTKEQTVTQLNNIESYIEDRPDSALITLQSLPKTESYSKRELARFSLLYAMALDKNYIDTADISIIQPAIDFFEKHGGADDKMKAYYYQGIAYLNQKDYPSAIISFTNAEEMIPYATDMRYVGLVYSRIADLYNISRNAEEDLKYISRAAKAFENSGIEKYKYSTLLRKGEA